MVSIPTIRSTTSSCQPPIIKQLGSVTVRPHVNSRVKTLSVAKPCVFSGKVASVVAEGGSLFPRLVGSIGGSFRQKVHRTVARVRFHRKIDKKLPCKVHFWKMSSAHRTVARKMMCVEHFWKMRSAKCAPDCGESSVSPKISKD